MQERLETLTMQFEMPYRVGGFASINRRWFTARPASLAGLILALLLPQLLLSITVGQEASPTTQELNYQRDTDEHQDEGIDHTDRLGMVKCWADCITRTDGA